MSCSIEGCDGAVRARGWCSKHYQRWKKHGDPLKVITSRPWLQRGQPPGDRHWNWKGNALRFTYRSAHARVAILRGRADAQQCALCGTTAEEWAYDHNDPAERYDEKGRAYSVDPDHYFAMCRSCHRRLDRAA